MFIFFLIINIVLLVTNIAIVIKRINLLRNKTKNTMYYSKLLFTIALITYCNYLITFVICYICILTGKAVGDRLGWIVWFSFSLALVIPVIAFMYYSSETYIEFNMVYHPRKHKSLDLEKSYILLHKSYK